MKRLLIIVISRYDDRKKTTSFIKKVFINKGIKLQRDRFATKTFINRNKK